MRAPPKAEDATTADYRPCSIVLRPTALPPIPGQGSATDRAGRLWLVPHGVVNRRRPVGPHRTFRTSCHPSLPLSPLPLVRLAHRNLIPFLVAHPAILDRSGFRPSIPLFCNCARRCPVDNARAWLDPIVAPASNPQPVVMDVRADVRGAAACGRFSAPSNRV